jgi:phosphatidylglycerol lysyltransferase
MRRADVERASHGVSPVFYLIDKDWAPLYAGEGFTVVRVAQEARVDLRSVSLAGRPELREIHARLPALGYSLEVVLPDRVSSLLADLKAVSAAALLYENAMELGFSRPYFNADYLDRLPLAVLRDQRRIVAFSALREGRDREELALDLTRCHPAAPDGSLDSMVLDLVLRAQAHGYHEFNLGIAPLSVEQMDPIAPPYGYEKILYCQNGRLYDTEDLYRWEALFPLAWRPKYLAVPRALNVYWTLHTIGRLISG